ncbi:MAG: SUMF1/EgtB/PvdO family nonheme iron enzyme [Kiritimatiellia bacterium]
MQSFLNGFRCPVIFLVRCLFCLWLWPAFGAAGEAPDTPGLAFLGVNEDADRWVNLFVGTREPDEVILLDRSRSDALMLERSLFLQAPDPDAERFSLGDWVSADILVVVETVEGEEEENGSDLVWFRALDVVTGVRLVDEIIAVDLDRPENGLASMDDLLRGQIVPSWRTLWGKGKAFAGVTLLDIRLVDAGTEDRQNFSPLYRILQRMIVQDASMILLERNLLDVLIEEETLSPGLRLNLRSGVVLLSGGVHQETEGAVFTLRGATPSNQTLFEESFLLDGGVLPSDLAGRALDLLSQHFSNSDSSFEPNLRLEAKRFHQLARYYYARKDLDRALDAVFTARALAPADRLITQSLYTFLYERVMSRVLNLRDPGSEELFNLLEEVRDLFIYLPAIRQPPYERGSGHHLMSAVYSRFGENIESDPECRAQWQTIEAIYHRSLEKVYQRETNLTNTPGENDRGRLMESLILTHRPFYVEHLKFLFEHDRRGRRVWSNPLPLEDVVELIKITESRPYMSKNFFRKYDAPFDPLRDDLYIRNLILSALSFVAGQSDETWSNTTSQTMRQCALLMVQNPLLWTRNKFHVVLDTPLEYRNEFQKAFKSVRNQVENEGWFVPELYFLDDWEMKPEVMKKALDPSLRLVSTADRTGRFITREQELSHRLKNWHEPETGGWIKMDVPPPGNPMPECEDILTDRGAGWSRVWHGRVWGDFLVAHVVKKPVGPYAGEALQVYEKKAEGIQQVKTLQFPHSDVETRIDDFNDKVFYQALLGGKRHLYYSHQHALYQFDREMNQVGALNLKEWGFPDYMVANLIESSQGVFLVLAKQHLHKQFDDIGRYSGGRGENNGGVLVLANDRLEPIQILANIERPTPQNELEALGPFDALGLFEEKDGTVLLGVGRYSNGAPWFEIGEDLKPRKREAPSQSENLSVWTSSMGYRENWDLSFLKSFYLKHGKSFGLINRCLPGRRLGGPFEFRRIVPFGEGVVVLKTESGRPDETVLPGLYYISNQGKPSDARMIMKMSGTEQFNMLSLWDEDLVLTGRLPKHRVIRKEAIEAFLSGGGGSPIDQTPFPDAEHLTAQKEMQQRFMKEVKPFSAPDTYPADPDSRDQLILVPGGDFILHSRGDLTGDVMRVIFPDLLVSETKVTHEEFFRVYKWAIHNGYRFSTGVDFSQKLDKLAHLPTRPVTDFSIVDAMLYCNARSEWEGLKPAYYLDPEHRMVLRTAKENGTYSKKWTNEHVDWNAGCRLPTEAEWERVARGADPTHTARYPWGNTITHDHANYLASDFFVFDRSTGGVHSAVAGQDPPVTCVKAFPPHGFEGRFYGLTGNVAELVWDRREWMDITEGEENKPPRRPMLYKGGSWATTADACTIQSDSGLDLNTVRNHGFRLVLPSRRNKNVLHEEPTP